jgi:hypothetical protein
VARIGSIFEEYARSHELYETICEDLGIGFSDIFPDFSESRRSMVNCLEDEEYPLFTKEGKESLSMRTATLRSTNHIYV